MPQAGFPVPRDRQHLSESRRDAQAPGRTAYIGPPPVSPGALTPVEGPDNRREVPRGVSEGGQVPTERPAAQPRGATGERQRVARAAQAAAPRPAERPAARPEPRPASRPVERSAARPSGRVPERPAPGPSGRVPERDAARASARAFERDGARSPVADRRVSGPSASKRRVPGPSASKRRVPGPSEPERRMSGPPVPGAGVPGRRTVTIHGRGAERGVPTTQRRRPPRRAHERVGLQPDRVALWAVLLGFVLILAAATSSHAAVIDAHPSAGGHASPARIAGPR